MRRWTGIEAQMGDPAEVVSSRNHFPDASADRI